jgi:hypothetical protein
MNKDLKTIQIKTTQYWYSDGVYELAFAALCLVLALFLLAQALLPQDTLINPILVSSFVLILLGSGFLLARLVIIAKVVLLTLVQAILPTRVNQGPPAGLVFSLDLVLPF